MKESLVLKEIFEVQPSIIYEAWLDSDMHSQMTGGEAKCSNEVGEPFVAWDGYIRGKNIELIENQKIVQTWRTTEFNEQDEDSRLTLELKKITKGTELILSHHNIPEGQTQYEQGWINHYFSPMKEFFRKQE